MKNKIFLFARSCKGEAREDSVSLAGEGAARFFRTLGAPALKIQKAENGRPYFEGERFFVSIAHSEKLFLAAFAENPCGVDCEKRRAVPARVQKRYLTASEQKEEFFAVWTRKEAAAKLVGVGISRISAISTASSFAEMQGDPRRICLLPLADFPGYAACLASFDAFEVVKL